MIRTFACALLLLSACSAVPDPKQLDVGLLECGWDHNTPIAMMAETPPGVCLRVDNSRTSRVAYEGEWQSACDVDDSRAYLVVEGGTRLAVWHKALTPNDDLPITRVDCATGAPLSEETP